MKPIPNSIGLVIATGTIGMDMTAFRLGLIAIPLRKLYEASMQSVIEAFVDKTGPNGPITIEEYSWKHT